MSKEHQSEYKEIVFTNPQLSSIASLRAEIESTAPLIPHRWSTKVGRMLEEKVTGKARGGREIRDFEEEMLECLHVIGKRPKTIEEIAGTRLGIPAVSFKSAIINCASLVEDFFKSHMRMLIWVDSDADGLVEIQFDPKDVTLRKDPARNSGRGSGVAIRARPQISKWTAKLNIRYNCRKISPEQLVDFLVNAGNFNGMGDWRPAGFKSTGNFGTFTVKRAVASVPNLTEKPAEELAEAKKEPRQRKSAG